MSFPSTNAGLVARVAAAAPAYLGGSAREGRVLEAMLAIDRAAFLPASQRRWAYLDEPVPIGWGQTCSEPSMVALMLDLLRIEPGQRILEVGSGSGYAAAIAGLLCCPGGQVYAAEILPELALAGRANCAACRLPSAPASSLLDWIEFLEADGSAGFPGLAPFDRIMLSAGVASPSFREEPLLGQLGPGGVLLYPQARGNLFRITLGRSGTRRESWAGVAFVPLGGRNS